MVYIQVSFGVTLINFCKNCLENVYWEGLKVNGKIKMDLTQIACHDDRLMAVQRNFVSFHKLLTQLILLC